ncbi:insulinase family protein [Sedimentibacter sp. zth1]|uniref:M16 family metallopeptidase n=1 Tax=Sedimentibacter sp. zth1 TaxID=2816908 RepID=UPI001A912433|nr:pitrilysin family protein [Sedimentibacter sp. zth1]QSX05336.1 insulinase family protein [Sedimentibacter sp. zth1]
MYDILNVYLENGLRVVMHKIPYSKTVACGVWVKQGSKHEDDQTNGLSHLVEHLIINVNNHNNPEFQKLIRELNDEGVVHNAGTTKENTNFYFTGLNKNLEKCIATLAEMVMHNKNFSEELLENEKKVVAQETISFYSSFNQIRERTSQALYGNMDVGRTIVGVIDNIKQANSDQLNYIMKNSYTPENSTIVIIGGIEYDAVLRIVEKYFSSWDDEYTRDYSEVVDSEPGIFFNEIAGGQSSVISVGFRTGAFNSKDRKKIDIISKIIGEPGFESRLVKEIRTKRGLAYNLGAFTNSYEHRGALGFTVVCAHDLVYEVVSIISDEIINIKQNGFNDEEIDRAKKILETRTMLDLDNILSQLKFLGRCTSYNHLFSLEQEVRNIKKINKEDLNNLANEIFLNEKMGFAGIGNFSIDKSIELLKI